jgi:HPt (histidine-containing phosphotransfer) domain-containing protein
MASNPPTMPPAMLEALGRLWTKFLPEIENRMAILESAARSQRSGSLSVPEREAAHQAAHKLAGVLGTFGLDRGTELARQAELGFSEEKPASATELSTWVAELRMLIDQRK